MSFSDTPAWFRYPEYHWTTKHAVVIGAGIAGCQMAWHLCQKNWQVTLIERHPKIASEASGNPAGVISPKVTARESPGETFYIECFKYCISLLDELKRRGIDIDWSPCGVLQLSHNQREQKRWLALKDRGFTNEFLQLINDDKASKISGIEMKYNASFFPQAGWIRPELFCKALSSDPNCQTILESEALKIKREQKHWKVFNGDNKSLAQAEVIIITSGKDIKEFSQSEFLPAIPVAGQTTKAQASEYSSQLKTVIGHEGYITPAIPSANKLHIFGASFERGVNNPKLSSEVDTENTQQLKQYLPDLADSFKLTNSAHTAVRMTTPDRFPYVGALADEDFYLKSYHDLHQGKQWKKYPPARYQQGLFILGGLGSRGLTTSGYCAKTLVDLLENKLESAYQKQLLRNCHPARFLIRNLKTA